MLPRFAEHVESLRKVAVNAAILLVLGVVAITSVRALNRSPVVIGAMEVSRQAEDLGFTGVMAARLLQDNIAAITQPNLQFGGTATALSVSLISATDLPDIQVPETGLSLATLVQFIRPLVGRTSTQIDGDVSVRDSLFVLTVRVDGDARQFSVPMQGPDSAFTLAALHVLEVLRPGGAAAHFAVSGDTMRAWRGVERAFALGQTRDSVDAFTVAGGLLGASGLLDRALESYLRAAALAPRAVAPLLGASGVARRAGRLSLSDSLLDAAYRRNPEDVAVLYELAMRSERRRQPRATDSLFRMLVARQLYPAWIYSDWADVVADRGDSVLATRLYGRALAAAVDPITRSGIYSNWGQTLIRNDWSPDRAVELLQASIAADTSLIIAHINLCDALRFAGRLREALEQCETTTTRYASGRHPVLEGRSQLDPEDPIVSAPYSIGRLHLAIAMVHLDLGDTTAALAQLHTVSEQDLVDPMPVYAKASLLRSLGRLDEAERLAVRLVEAHPSLPSVHTLVGDVLAQRGRHGAARRAYERAATSGGTSSAISTGLAAVLLASGDTAQAIKTMREGTAGGRGESVAERWAMLARAREQARSGDGMLVLLLAHQRGDSAAEMRQQLFASAGGSAHRVPPAVLDRMRAAAPNDLSGLTATVLGVVLNQQDKDVEAIKWLSGARSRWGTDSLLQTYGLRALATSFATLQRTREATAVLQQLRVVSPRESGTIRYVAQQAAVAGDFATAEALMRQVGALEQLTPHDQVVLGILLLEQQRGGDAVVWLRRATRGDPRHFSAHFYLGVALWDACQRSEARVALDRAIALASTSSERELTAGLQEKLDASPPCQPALGHD